MRALNAMASQILNDIYEGLKAPANPSINLIQLKSTIGVMRNRIIDELARKGQFDPNGSYVRYKVDLTEGDYMEQKRLLSNIPPAITVHGFYPYRYAGFISGEEPFRIATQRPNEGRKLGLTGNAPTVYIDAEGEVVLVKPPSRRIAELLVEYVPNDLSQIYDDDEPCPIPGWLDGLICSKLTDGYIRHYSMKNPQPVTGADIIEMVMGNRAAQEQTQRTE